MSVLSIASIPHRTKKISWVGACTDGDSAKAAGGGAGGCGGRRKSSPRGVRLPPSIEGAGGANQPDQPENNNHLADQTEQAAASLAAEQAASTPMEGDQGVPPTQERVDNATPTTPTTPPMTNGDRTERPEYTPAPSIEGGRRTPRGELFRRPPQPPAPPPAAFALSPSVQAPTHEIFFCHWATCFTWPIIQAIPARMRRATSCCVAWLMRRKLVAALAAGIVAPSPSPMIAGIHGVKPLVK